MKLIRIALSTFVCMMIIVLTGCARPLQAQSKFPVGDETNSLMTLQVDDLKPISTESALPTKREVPLELPPGLTVEEYALVNPPVVEPLSFLPVQGSQEGILTKHYDERLKTFPDNSFFDGKDYAMRAQLCADELVARQQYNETGSDGWVTVIRNGEEIYRIGTGPGGPISVAALSGLWAYADHWVLETAKIIQRLEGNLMIKEAISQISRDGELLNDLYSYQEMFGFQIMAGAPFYFFKQDDKINFSFDGQVVMAGYDEIPHYGCCSSGALNPVSAENMAAFFTKRDNVWYYVEIGVYKHNSQPETLSHEVHPCIVATDFSQPEEVVRAFLDEISEGDLLEAKPFWIQEVWIGGIDQLVASWASGQHKFTIGTTTYAGFFAPGDYRPMEADDPRVSDALVSATIDGEQGSFDLEKTCNDWLISGWIVLDKIKE